MSEVSLDSFVDNGTLLEGLLDIMKSNKIDW